MIKIFEGRGNSNMSNSNDDNINNISIGNTDQQFEDISNNDDNMDVSF